MLKKITSSLLVFAVFTISPTVAISQVIQITGPNIELKYDLLPGKPTTITNYWFLSISGECKIYLKKESSTEELTEEPTEAQFFAKVKSGTVTFKDISLSNDESQEVTVPLNEYVEMSATSGASLELTNQSEYPLIAACRN